MTKAKKHMAKVASIGCVLCDHMGLEKSPAEVHHIGDSAERDDFLTVALCPAHHRGPNGFHGLGEKAFNTRYKLNELTLLAMTLKGIA